MPAADTPPADLAAALQDAVAELHAAADPKRAAFVRNYLKSPFEMVGVTKPAVNAAASGVRRRCPKLTAADLLPALVDLWASDIHEVKTLAVRLTGVYHRVWSEDDVAGSFHRWLTKCRTWDHTDDLSINTIGAVALRRPAVYSTIAAWAAASELWVRRASLLAHIPAIRRGALDSELLTTTCERLVAEREFFLRKAFGWVLRELSLRDPDQAEALILRLRPRLATLSLREGVRRLEAERRARIVARIPCGSAPPPEGISAADHDGPGIFGGRDKV